METQTVEQEEDNSIGNIEGSNWGINDERAVMRAEDLAEVQGLRLCDVRMRTTETAGEPLMFEQLFDLKFTELKEAYAMWTEGGWSPEDENSLENDIERLLNELHDMWAQGS